MRIVTDGYPIQDRPAFRLRTMPGCGIETFVQKSPGIRKWTVYKRPTKGADRKMKLVQPFGTGSAAYDKARSLLKEAANVQPTV